MATPSRGSSNTENKKKQNASETSNQWENISDEIPDIFAPTLYNLTTRVEFMVRKTEPGDMLQISKFLGDETRQLFCSLDIGKLFEKSLFSVVLMDLVKINDIVAHASFSDMPQDKDINIDGKIWKNTRELRDMDSLNTLFMTFFCCSPEIDIESAVQEILRNTFIACALVDYILLEAPSLNYKGSMYFPHMCRECVLTKFDKSKRKLIIFDKNMMYPRMKIREGREHDLDDLSPLMTLKTGDMEENFNKSYLNDLIAMSDRNNQSVVAEHKSIAVGMLTVTTDINYSMLNSFFQLEPYHGLYKPHLKDEINLAFQQSDDDHKVCKADERKYVTDDYEESLEGSDNNSRLDSSGSSETVTSSSSASDASGTTTVGNLRALSGDAAVDTPKRVHSRVNSRGVATRDVTTKISNVIPNAASNNATIIPMVPSNEDAIRSGDELQRTAKNSVVEEDIRRIPREIVNMHEQLRQGNLKVEDVEGLDDDMKAMFSKLEDLYAKRDNENSMFHVTSEPYPQPTLTDFNCYPMTVMTDRKPVYHGIPNALAIQLCVMDKKYNIRILDLIQGAFLCFPNREYCIITVPFGSPIPSWLQYFVKVVHRKRSLFDRELYVLHRSVFNCKLRVRQSTDRDTQKVRKLVDSLYFKDIIMSDYNRALIGQTQGHYAFVAAAGPPQQSHIIGLVILSDNEKNEHYQVNYNTDELVYADMQEPTDYAYVHHFILNPPFRRFAKKILKEVMRYLNKNVLLHCVYSPYRESMSINHQTLLNNLDDWYLVAPRPRINYKKIGLTDIYDEDRIPPPEALDFSEPYALLLHARKFTFDLKAEVTTRIVFVGASDTSLACIEKLITTQKLNFLHLTLISPNGLPGSLQPDEIRFLMFPRREGPTLSVDTPGEWFDRVGIHLKVNILFGKVTSILREQKVVVVNRQEVVPYDVLILTVGQQFLRPDFGEIEIVDSHLTEFIENSVQQDEKKKEKIQRPLRRHTKKPKNVFVINSEMDAAVALNFVRTQLPFFRRQRLLIHGACLDAYCCLNAMLRMGVSPERLVFIIRPDFHMEWESRLPYSDTIKLRETMLETFRAYSIKVLPNHDFLDWFLDLRTNTVTRVNFAPPNESEIVSYSCFAYFGYSQRRIGDEFLSALLDSYITFDKGISIGTDFKTNDKDIWAAGPCSAYDNKLVAGKFDHPFYSSYEVGTLLADKLIRDLDPTKRKYRLTRTSKKALPLPQIMTKQVVHYAELPGGWFYMYCRRPGPMPICCSTFCACVHCDCGTEITTGSTDAKEDRNQRYFRLWLTPEYAVQGMECISRKRFSAYNLSTMFGSHESLLHNLVERFERGEIQCLYDFFQQPWAGAICHDRWSDFRAELSEFYSTFFIDGETKINDFIKAYVDNLENPEALKVDANIIRRIFDSSGLKRRIELRFLDFLRFNRTCLPMYARPDFVEKLIEDRRLSPLMDSRFPPL